MDVDEWTNELLRGACKVIIKYEDHLRSKGSIGEARELARAMRELRDNIPDDVLEVMRG